MPIDEIIPDSPDAIDRGPLDTPAVLVVETLPEYDVVYEGDTVAFAVNDTPSLVWVLTNRLGNTYPPKSGTLTLSRPDGVNDPIATIYISSNVPAASIKLSQVYQFAMAGVYVAKLQVTIDDGSTPVQTRSSLVTINVT